MEVTVMFQYKSLLRQLREEKQKNIELAQVVSDQSDALVELAGIIEEIDERSEENNG